MVYTYYDNITKEILDTIKVGNLIKINDWKKPLRVRAVSENYFVMTRKIFGKTLYSVCSKLPWNGIRYNAMSGGMFHCGTDNWTFGFYIENCDDLYEFNNEESNELYLKAFEDGECELSHRTSVPIYTLYVKEK